MRHLSRGFNTHWTFTSSARQSIHSYFTPVSVKLHLFLLRGRISPVIPFAIPFFRYHGLATRESDTSFCCTFTPADIWSMMLHVVTPAATFLTGVGVWGGPLPGVGVESLVGCDSCLQQSSDGNVLSSPYFVATAELFIQGIFSVISLNCVILSECALILDFHTWSSILYLWVIKAQPSSRGRFWFRNDFPP